MFIDNRHIMFSPQSNAWLGRFWLASADEATAVPGVLEFGADGVAAVLLEGSRDSPACWSDAVVFARFPDRHTTATLFNCFGSTSFGADGPISSEFSSTLVAVGGLHTRLLGSAIQFQLPGAETWFNDESFTVDHSAGSKEIVVRFKAYELRRYRLSEELQLERFYAATVPFSSWASERFTVERPMAFRVRSKSTTLTFDRLWMEMVKVQRFFEFFSQYRTRYESLRLYSTMAAKGGPDIEVRHSHPAYVPSKSFVWDQQLVTYEVLRKRLSKLLIRWHAIYSETPDPFDRYFAAFERERKDPIFHFLWNAAAFEELHKLRTGRKGTTLAERLKEARTKWLDGFDDAPGDTALSEIKDTRHYYAHAAGDLRVRAAKDWVLFRYGFFLAALCNLEILAMLEFAEQEIVHIAGTYWMRQALGLRLFPEPGK